MRDFTGKYLGRLNPNTTRLSFWNPYPDWKEIARIDEWGTVYFYDNFADASNFR